MTLISRVLILKTIFEAFNFTNKSDINNYEKLLKEGFELISGELEKIDQVFVDTKFEFGYVTDGSWSRKTDLHGRSWDA